jgi:choline dehydrogenase-like flavoprotein
VTLPTETKEQVLRSHVTIAELVSRGDRLIEDDSGPWRVRQIGDVLYPVRPAVGQPLLDSLLQPYGTRAEGVEDIHNERVLFAEQTDQKMLGPDVIMMAALGFLARLYQGTAYPAGKVVTAQESSPRGRPKILRPAPRRKDEYREATFIRAKAASQTGDSMSLTKRETDALEALADTFVPSLAFEKDEDPALFSMAASDLGVGARVAEALERLDPAKRNSFRLFLRLLENPLFMAGVSSSASPFSRLSQQKRERVLQRLARSSVPQLRSAYNGARSLVLLHTYAANGSPESAALLSAIGYEPEINRKSTAPHIPLAKLGQESTLECDVCVVGSGAAGSVIAAELAASGQDVLVVEAGSEWSGPDYDQHELAGMQHLFRQGGLSGTRDLSMSLLAGACIGGGTTVNWQSCFRTPDDVREEWARSSGCDFFTSESFTESLDTVWRRIGASTDESEINESNNAICRGAKSLGYRWSVIARNSLGCDCAQCGNCMFGCRVGGKQSAANTYLLDAIRSGARIMAPFSARRLVQSGGRVTGIEGIAGDADGNVRDMKITTPRVVIAAGGLESPALLMRSGVPSPDLGRHLYLHPTVAVIGTYSSPIEPWAGPPQTAVCDQFSSFAKGYGYRIEAAPAHPGLSAVAVPWSTARQHRREMQQLRFAAPFIVLTRDSNSGRVRITRDGEPYFDYRLGSAEKRLLKHGMATAARMHFAAKADRILTLHSVGLTWDRAESGASIEKFCRQIDAASTGPNRLPLFSAHQMGTCRMGANRADAVCDPDGAVYGVKGAYVADASLFPASSGVNPMITIMALARHVAKAMTG